MSGASEVPDGQAVLFDQAAFARSIRIRLAERNITLRDGAKEVGCSHATLCRVASLGKSPDVENYLRIKRWLGEGS